VTLPHTLPAGAEAFLAAIVVAPDDPAPRLVFADWLEEQGRTGAAAACRWLAAGGKPYRDASESWTWFRSDQAVRADWFGRQLNPEGLLPPVPGLTLPGGPHVVPYAAGVVGRYWEFPTREAAERALLMAWPDGVLAPPRVRSGGQTGVDRAALDAAMLAGLPVCGFTPRGRMAEDGRVPDFYPLTALRRGGYPARAKANVEAADATLALTLGVPAGGTLLTIRHADSVGRPVLVVDLLGRHDPAEVVAWVCRHAPRDLNVAGPREGDNPGVHARARVLLEDVFWRWVEGLYPQRA
jgi:uncharacterized protein (TIGR02996 family)